jgi:hypothetical protein
MNFNFRSLPLAAAISISLSACQMGPKPKTDVVIDSVIQKVGNNTLGNNTYGTVLRTDCIEVKNSAPIQVAETSPRVQIAWKKESPTNTGNSGENNNFEGMFDDDIEVGMKPVCKN